MLNLSKSFDLSDCRVGTAHQSRFCHCERSEAISLHHSLFLVRHSIFTTTFAFLLLLLLIAAPAYAKYGGGTGEPNDPYLIFDANQMNEIGLHQEDWASHFKLMADIDLSAFTGTSFNIIGYYNYPDAKPFTGVFDGNGHTISNFSYTSTEGDYIGLFVYVEDPNAVMKDLALIDPNVDAGTGRRVGSLVGWLRDGTITGCFAEGGSVLGDRYVGGLVGVNGGTITNCYVQGGSVSGDWYGGGLVGVNGGTITKCYSTGSVAGYWGVGGLVGRNDGTINNCYASGGVLGKYRVGGLVGFNGWSGPMGFYLGTISNCYATGNVTGTRHIGGLVGQNWVSSTSTNCYATGSISGDSEVGGLVGGNYNGTITNCYSTASVSGGRRVGGLVGEHWWGTVINCYSTGSVSGDSRVGGLAGTNYSGSVSHSFWDIETSGQATSAGGTGLQTAEMQTKSTFTDAAWEFSTPVWTIDEGVYYPRLFWELAPALHAEPEVTLGTSNTITWDPVPGANDYYAECAADANFTSIIYNTGWITETSCEFTGLEVGQRYCYSVKARNSAGTETGWSNVESSLQKMLADAVDMMLDPNTLKNENLKNALLNKINVVLEMLDEGFYAEALNKLQNDILQKTNGCAETGQPDKNDWIITCQGQSVLYPLVIETIENVKGLID